jgi:hypothetical protein
MNRTAKSVQSWMLAAVVFVVVGVSLSAQRAAQTQAIMKEPPHKLFVLVDDKPKPCGSC